MHIYAYTRTYDRMQDARWCRDTSDDQLLVLSFNFSLSHPVGPVRGILHPRTFLPTLASTYLNMFSTLQQWAARQQNIREHKAINQRAVAQDRRVF